MTLRYNIFVVNKLEEDGTYMIARRIYKIKYFHCNQIVFDLAEFPAVPTARGASHSPICPLKERGSAQSAALELLTARHFCGPTQTLKNSYSKQKHCLTVNLLSIFVSSSDRKYELQYVGSVRSFWYNNCLLTCSSNIN